MVSEFVRRVSSDFGLFGTKAQILATADIRSFDDLDSLTRFFPSISEAGVRLPMLSNIAAMRTSLAYSRVAAAAPTLNQAAGSGAERPQGAPWPVGTPAPVGIPASGTPLPASRLDVRIPQWPIRDQGNRGTCVAFAAAACAEHTRAAAGSPVQDLSEQFLYWAIKTSTADPNPSHDGTFLQFARDALGQMGVCEEHLWPYVSKPGTTVTQETPADPSGAARANAGAGKFGATSFHQSTGTNNDANVRLDEVFSALRRGRPVAITLPMFRDPILPQGPSNWTTPVGWAYGHVLDPPPRSIVVSGHAVCIVGFEPDQNEPRGGHFIFRNSWGTTWASQAPASGYGYSPEVGYGVVSATYVAEYLWELLQL
jgi:hypothetical protein